MPTGVSRDPVPGDKKLNGAISKYVHGLQMLHSFPTLVTSSQVGCSGLQKDRISGTDEIQIITCSAHRL